jgi:uncharacterized membrane protein YqjE
MSDRAAIITAQPSTSVREILRDIAQDLQYLVHSEMRLAKVEVIEQLDRARGGAGFMGAAAVLGLLAGICLVAMCVALLALLMPVWGAALIVTLLLAAAGQWMYVLGRDKLRRFRPVPRQMIQAIKDDVQWVKQRTR